MIRECVICGGPGACRGKRRGAGSACELRTVCGDPEGRGGAASAAAGDRGKAAGGRAMVKEKLRRYGDRRQELRQIRRMLAELEARMTAPRAQALTGTPGSPSRDPDKLTGLVARAEELRGQYRRCIEELTAAQLEVERLIETLEPREREIFRLRYIDGTKWEDICVIMSYSWRQVHRAHSAALQKLEDAEKETGEK